MNESFKYIVTEQSADLSVIWLNRPEKGNAFNLEMIRELTHKIKSLEEEPDIRFALLKAKGKHFCLGADLKWMGRAVTLTDRENQDECLTLASLLETIYCSSKIMIAYIQGACYGGGVGLAAACDFTFALPDVRFAFGEVKLGLVPATIAPVAVQRMGAVKAMQLMLAGVPFSADEAMKLGLIDHLLTRDKAEVGLNDFLKSLRMGNRNAQQHIKELIRKIQPDIYSKNIKEFTARLLAESRVSEEGVEGIMAFLEKRTPNWRENDS